MTSSRDGTLPPATMPRGQGPLVSINFGPDHYALCDVARAYAFISLPAGAAANRNWTRYHFLEPLGWMLIDSLHTVLVHASAVALNGRGAAILCGESGCGKTSLAYACARQGWTFLSGDATHLVRRQSGFEVRGRPAQIRFRASAAELFPELASQRAAMRPSGKTMCPSGKTDIETSACRLGVPAAYKGQATHIVFLQLRSNRLPRASIPVHLVKLWRD